VGDVGIWKNDYGEKSELRKPEDSAVMESFQKCDLEHPFLFS